GLASQAGARFTGSRRSASLPCLNFRKLSGPPLLVLTRLNACWQFSRSQTSSISASVSTGLSCVRFAVSVSIPCPSALGASLLLSARNASPSCSGWLFCRLSLMSRVDYLPLPLPCSRRTVRAFAAHATNTPSADFCRPVRTDHSILSRDSTANDRSPEVSSTAFRTQPPNLQPVLLMK